LIGGYAGGAVSGWGIAQLLTVGADHSHFPHPNAFVDPDVL
jgi:hypothetical protein